MAPLNQPSQPLESYPRPSMAVDTAVLTVPANGSLSVLVVGDPTDPILPGTFLHPGERLSDAVLRSLRTKAGVEGLRPRQLHVFDDPERDPRGWVLSAAHVDVVPAARLPESGQFGLIDVSAIRPMPYQHDQIVALAVAEVRERYRASADPDELLDEPFTLRALHALHEAILGEKLQRDTFRRNMLRSLAETGERETGAIGKPAQLYRRAAQ